MRDTGEKLEFSLTDPELNLSETSSLEEQSEAIHDAMRGIQ